MTRLIHHGRGATGNPASRFDAWQREAVDDGWSSEDEPTRLKTTVEAETCRSILSRNTSPDIPFEVSLNPYRGCEHGCIYCYARPTHACLGLSPGLDFETRLYAKYNAPEILEKTLRSRGYQPQPIALGGNTDPYQPIEREHGLTRALLQVLRDFRHPLTITTKNSLIERDLDLLADLSQHNLVRVYISLATLDKQLARQLEPRATAPLRRLETIRRLSRAGVPVGVLVAPIIPALNEHTLEQVLREISHAGAKTADYVLLRLPREVAGLFGDWLDIHYPGKARHVMHLIQQSRGGRLNDSRFGHRMRGDGVFADLIAQRFRIACKRLELNQLLSPLETGLFKPPPLAGAQLDLF